MKTNLRIALALLIFLNISSASALSGFLSGWYLQGLHLMLILSIYSVSYLSASLRYFFLISSGVESFGMSSSSYRLLPDLKKLFSHSLKESQQVSHLLNLEISSLPPPALLCLRWPPSSASAVAPPDIPPHKCTSEITIKMILCFNMRRKHEKLYTCSHKIFSCYELCSQSRLHISW